MAKSKSTMPPKNPLGWITGAHQEEPVVPQSDTLPSEILSASSADYTQTALPLTKGVKSDNSDNDAKSVNDTVSVSNNVELPIRKKTVRLPATVPADLAERVYRAAYWDRETIAEIITEALTREMERREAERGESYPPAGKIRTGRPPINR